MAKDGNPGADAGYSPIEDYAAIGNLRSVALVSRRGSIDWCCFPGLDAGSVFGAILDTRRGGRFRVAPAGIPRRGGQRYLEDTNVLESWWETDDGRLTVTDFMPLRGSILGRGDPDSAPCIYRVLRCEGGSCAVEVEWSPRFDYGRARTRIDVSGGAARAEGGGERMCLIGLPAGADVDDDGAGPVARAAFTIRAGACVPLYTGYGDVADADPNDWEPMLRQTATSWRAWLRSRDDSEPADFAGAWQPLVDRSALALKLLTYPRTGAIAAAPTTSLPEHIGGERNWDYRYTWIRDAAFTAQALVATGHRSEAIEFIEWAENTCMHDEEKAGKLHLMYTLYGESEIAEHELDHLEGYRGSRPVRIGNGAAGQFQLDIFGELLGAAYELARLGVPVDDAQWNFLTRVADQACAQWQQPDYGIWEVRSERQHFVYSKLMVWVALDRAIRLAEARRWRGDVERWRRTCAAVRKSLLENGYDAERGAFVQAYGTRALDAANLLIPMVGFLPHDDARVQRTIDRTLEELTENGLVYRYRVAETDDGLSGDEGAFGLTTFWMIDALALSGRIDEACAMFETCALGANHVGLYAEQIDPQSGVFLGNFPQAFTHIGLMNSAVYLAYAEGRSIPGPPPIGSPAAQHAR